MLIIRYRRVGKRNHAQYKIVVAEKSFPVKGKFLEDLGSFDPHSKETVLKQDRIKHWLNVGAQCSDSVHNLLVSQGLIKEDKRKVSIREKKKGDEKEEAKAEEKSPEKGDEKEGEAPAKESKPEEKEASAKEEEKPEEPKKEKPEEKEEKKEEKPEEKREEKPEEKK